MTSNHAGDRREPAPNESHSPIEQNFIQMMYLLVGLLGLLAFIFFAAAALFFFHEQDGKRALMMIGLGLAPCGGAYWCYRVATRRVSVRADQPDTMPIGVWSREGGVMTARVPLLTLLVTVLLAGFFVVANLQESEGETNLLRLLLSNLLVFGLFNLLIFFAWRVDRRNFIALRLDAGAGVTLRRGSGEEIPLPRESIRELRLDQVPGPRGIKLRALTLLLTDGQEYKFTELGLFQVVSMDVFAMSCADHLGLPRPHVPWHSADASEPRPTV